MIDISPEEWTQISLGNLEGLKAKYDDPEFKRYLDDRQAHIKDRRLFEQLYLWQGTQKLDFPPEYSNGFALDGRLETLLQVIKNYGAKSILDIGSRAGYLLFAGKQRGVIDKGVGVEVATCYYNLCLRAKMHHNISEINFVNSMIEDYNTEERFDCAVIAEVLEHVMNPVEVLKKARDLLKSDGHLIITVPTDRTTVSAEEIEIIKSERVQEHVHYFNRDSLKSLAESAGFKYVEAFSIGQGWITDISVYSA